MTKKALITGITGQDGSYLAELLLENGYEVHGMVRRMATPNEERLSRIHHLLNEIVLHAGSLENYASLCQIVQRVIPDEVYHLAAQSFVGYSFEDPFSTMQINVSGTQYMLAAIRELAPDARFYFAGTSEMIGNAPDTPQNENTRFYPCSPYAISKVAGYWLTRNVREAYGLFACSGILYNHESPRRGLEFVTRKITSTAARIKLGLTRELRLGSLEPRRDWGHAREYVRAMWLMLQQQQPDDYVIASGTTHSVQEFVELAFRLLDLDYREFVISDPKLERPAEVHLLLGDASKAKRQLGWECDVSFENLVGEMVYSDLEFFSRRSIQFPRSALAAGAAQ